MDVADALIFALLGAGDFLLMVYLRRRRHRHQRQEERLARSLRVWFLSSASTSP